MTSQSSDHSKTRKPSAKARRSAARLLAAQAVYQASLNEQSLKSSAQEYLDHRRGMEVDGEMLVEADRALFSSIMTGVEERKSDLSHVIGTNYKSSTAHTEPLIKAIIMCAAYELLAHQETDAPIIINDYLNVAHAFFEKGEVSLINGVLDGVRKALRD